MKDLLFAIAFVTFCSAPDGLDRGLGAWVALIASAAYMIWMIRAEEKRASLHKRKAPACGNTVRSRDKNTQGDYSTERTN